MTELIGSEWTVLSTDLSQFLSSSALSRVKLEGVIQELSRDEVLLNDFTFKYEDDVIKYWSPLDQSHNYSDENIEMNVKFNETKFQLYLWNLRASVQYRLDISIYMDDTILHYHSNIQTKSKEDLEFRCVKECYTIQEEIGEYEGRHSKSNQETICQRWDTDYPHKIQKNIKDFMKKDGKGNHNYCRMPKIDKNLIPWCYTMNKTKRWRFCDVPKCSKYSSRCFNISFVRIEKNNLIFNWKIHSNEEDDKYLLIFQDVLNRNRCTIFAVNTESDENYQEKIDEITEHYSLCKEAEETVKFDQSNLQMEVNVSNIDFGVQEMTIFSFSSRWKTKMSGNFTQSLLFHDKSYFRRVNVNKKNVNSISIYLPGEYSYLVPPIIIPFVIIIMAALTYRFLYPQVSAKTRKKMSLDQFKVFYHRSHDHQYQQEFDHLKMLTRAMITANSLSCNEASQPHNQHKNKFKHILPYDHTGVLLHSLQSSQSDYINASYVSGENGEDKTYIAAQGPLSSSVEDFWRMIWQEEVEMIVMLTNPVEGGKRKCVEYWPENVGDKLEVEIFGEEYAEIKLIVTNILGEKKNDFEMRKWRCEIVNLTSSSCSESEQFNKPPRSISQLHYTGWPDHDVPDLHSFSQFLLSTDSLLQSSQKSSPLLVHCSAGVGRTGTFICCHRLLLYLRATYHLTEKDTEIDLSSLILELRRCRPFMIQNVIQFKFVHHYLAELIDGYDPECVYFNM